MLWPHGFTTGRRQRQLSAVWAAVPLGTHWNRHSQEDSRAGWNQDTPKVWTGSWVIVAEGPPAPTQESGEQCKGDKWSWQVCRGLPWPLPVTAFSSEPEKRAMNHRLHLGSNYFFGWHYPASQLMDTKWILCGGTWNGSHKSDLLSLSGLWFLYLENELVDL